MERILLFTSNSNSLLMLVKKHTFKREIISSKIQVIIFIIGLCYFYLLRLLPSQIGFPILLHVESFGQSIQWQVHILLVNAYFFKVAYFITIGKIALLGHSGLQ